MMNKSAQPKQRNPNPGPRPVYSIRLPLDMLEALKKIHMPREYIERHLRLDLIKSGYLLPMNKEK